MVKNGGLMFQSAAKHEGTSASFFTMIGFISNVWFLSDIGFFLPKRHFIKIVTKVEKYMTKKLFF